MADFDIYSNAKLVTASAAGATFDGATPSSSIDTDGWKGLNFVFALEATVAWSAISVTMEESDDNSTWSSVASDNIIFRKGEDVDTVDIFHAGYIGKKQYVRASANTGGTGKAIACLGKPHVSPHDQAALESA